jgi:hypothetical protein
MVEEGPGRGQAAADDAYERLEDTPVSCGDVVIYIVVSLVTNKLREQD